ncbi:membrane protein [Desulfuromonas versatilis]|uniref:peptidoglycan lytic exotransglycosylase n=1 Tax=Desulfuromonas versatilis TaxID=2802975 RepID=A0ABN6E2R2_9BACT|nr:membrane protein [Desulfuromonas versatilis]
MLLCLASCTLAPEVAPPAPPPPPVPQVVVPALTPVPWELVDGWPDPEPGPALEAFLKSCQGLKSRPQFQSACSAAKAVNVVDPGAVQRFFEQYFTPHQVRNVDGTGSGLITGYYVPELKGSRMPTARHKYPLYGLPDDLLVIDLRSVYPELGDYRLRGRVVGRKVVPYWDRTVIDGPQQPLAGKELFWVEDPVELFFLHIQGSGRISLPGGEKIMLNYADQNGHPYRSIGKLLLERGAMTRDQMSMQNIKEWARQNPESVAGLLGENPSYVFFRELDPGVQVPPGALGVPLTPGRSLAVDPRTIPLGAPVFIATTWPGGGGPLRRLMAAQDTGGAIKGRVRADFFWGLGEEAGSYAGRTKQAGWLWVLLPKEAQTQAGAKTRP